MQDRIHFIPPSPSSFLVGHALLIIPLSFLSEYLIEEIDYLGCIVRSSLQFPERSSHVDGTGDSHNNASCVIYLVHLGTVRMDIRLFRDTFHIFLYCLLSAAALVIEPILC